jgi:hypothetical protein
MHFQVMSVNGRPNRARSGQDCHILNHEDRGMMAVVDIEP